MNATSSLLRRPFASGWKRSAILVGAALIVGVAVGRMVQRPASNNGHNAQPSPATPHESERSDDPTIVRFSTARQSAAGIKTALVERSQATEFIRATGKLAVNEERLAHMNSPVDGVLRQVGVAIGEKVAAGQTLAVVDSKEVGQAKLDLAKNHLNVTFAQANHQWAETIHKNTQALIAALREMPAVLTLENRFQDQPMGDNRQMLISAYAKFHSAEADYLRLKTLREQNVGVEKDFIHARSDYEAASASYQALLEQLKFVTQRQLRESEQKLQEAVTAERMSRASLLILGFSEKEVNKLDPLGEGEAVAHYPIRAPFAGTVIGKHAVLSEYVGPNHQLFEIADLSKIWIHADVFEKDLAKLAKMSGKAFHFHTAGYADRDFTAELYHLGDAVDEKTRAVKLIATAENVEQLLKPGMFVEVYLPVGGAAEVIRIPQVAVLRDNDRAYVFVVTGDETFQSRTVRLGTTDRGQVEIGDGLKAGEKIVVDGGFALKSEMLRDQLAE